MKQAVRKRVAKPAEERRVDLMDAALRVFLEKGAASTTVADITDAAGVAKGTFYLYFDSKEALLGALKERFVDDMIAHASQFAERVGREDWWILAEATAEGWVDFALEHRAQIRLFAQEGVTVETFEPFAECEAKLHGLFVAGIEAGTRAGAFHVTDPELTAHFVSKALEGTVEHAILFGAAIDRDALVTGAKELVRKVLGPSVAS
ncbi:MAG TPA: TetR/AcrR family transcriptional regulator [Actinomycetota bacterium]|nr:TetR/AcrR family transcriptional regulator [Actinomycetota bacterium]